MYYCGGGGVQWWPSRCWVEQVARLVVGGSLVVILNDYKMFIQSLQLFMSFFHFLFDCLNVCLSLKGFMTIPILL
jgi:hypothetical protein